MITTAVMNFTMLIPLGILMLLDPFEFNIVLPDNIFNALSDMTSGVAYVVPVGTFLTIFSIRISILIFKCTWSVIIRIKSFIPTFGA